MKPRPNQEKSPQQELFRQELEQLIDPSHVLVKLAHRMNWEHFDKEFGTKYCETNGRPAINTRLMVSIHLDSTVSEKTLPTPPKPSCATKACKDWSEKPKKTDWN